MKKILPTILLCLFLSGCKIEFGDSFGEKAWKKLGEVGETATFTMTHRYTDEERYYRIERISKEDFKSLRTE